jgi:hypothetical protein
MDYANLELRDYFDHFCLVLQVLRAFRRHRQRHRHLEEEDLIFGD